MEMEGMGFREALEHLAKKAGVVLKELPRAAQADVGDRLRSVNAFAQEVYRRYLASSAGEQARAYLASRGIDQTTMDRFGLGYAPKEWTTLVEAAKKKGMSMKELGDAGLALTSKGPYGMVDRFRHRLMIPLKDAQGRTVAFTGRVLDPKDEPKYMNSPQTPVYDKGRLLFGLDGAKTAIRREKAAVIVEGNMDVIASHQAGVEWAIACSGTAFTVHHALLLKRYTHQLIFCFDADAAGFAAARRAMQLAASEGFDVAVVPLDATEGKDPDEVVRRRGPDAWRALVGKAVPRMEWLFARLVRSADVADVEAKKVAAREFAHEIATLPNAIEREHWQGKLAAVLGVSAQAAGQAVVQAQREVSRLHQGERTPAPQANEAPTPEPVVVSDRHAALPLAPSTPAERAGWLALSLAWSERPLAEVLVTQTTLDLFPPSLHDLYNATVLVYHQTQFAPTTYGFEAIRAQIASPTADHALRSMALEAERVHGLERLPSGAFPPSLLLAALKRLANLALDERKRMLLADVRRAEAANDHEQVDALMHAYQRLMSETPPSL
jgi:DNA primase